MEGVGGGCRPPHEMQRVKAAYFFYAASIACIYPFLPLFYKNALGATKTEMGFVMMMGRIGMTVGAGIWTLLADRYSCHKITLASITVVSTFLCFSQTFSSSFHLGLSFLWLLAECFRAGVEPLISAWTYAVLPFHGRASYGKQRLFSSFGWGTFTYVTGAIVEATNVRYLFAPFLVLSVLLLFVIRLVHFPQQSASPGKSHQGGEQVAKGGSEDVAKHSTKSRSSSSSSGRMWRELPVVCSWRLAVTLATAVANGTFLGVIDTTLFLHIQSLGGGESLMGLVDTIRCVAEVPFLFFSSRVLNTLSPNYCLSLAALVYGIRLLAYSRLSEPHYFPFIAPLHALSYALSWVAGLEMVQGMAKAAAANRRTWQTQTETQAQTQTEAKRTDDSSNNPVISSLPNNSKADGPDDTSLLSTFVGWYFSAYYGVGIGCGAMVGGWLMDEVGVGKLYDGFAGVAFTMAALLLLGAYHHSRKYSNYKNIDSGCPHTCGE